MLVRQLLFFAIIFSFAVCCSSLLFAEADSNTPLRSNQPRRRKNWVVLPNRVAQDSDTISFQIFLNLNQENEKKVSNLEEIKKIEDEIKNKIHAGSQNQEHDHIGIRLVHWRSLLAPTQDSVTKANEFLADSHLAKYCGSLLWDHFRCQNVPLSVARNVFPKTEFQHVQDELSFSTRLVATEHPKYKEDQVKDFVSHFSNIQILPRHAQRQSRQLAKNSFENIIFSSSDSPANLQQTNRDRDGDDDDDYPNNPMYIPLQTPLAPTAQSPAPAPLLVTIGFHDTVTSATHNTNDQDCGKVRRMAVTPFCLDGSLPTLTSPSGSALTCNGTTVVPATINWQAVSLTGANFDQLGSTVLNAGSIPVSSTYCVSAGLAGSYSYAATNTTNVPLCARTFSLSSQNSLPDLKRPYIVQVQTLFSNGATSAWSSPVNFLNTSYFNPANTTRFPVDNIEEMTDDPSTDTFYKTHPMYGDAPNIIAGRTMATFLPSRGLFANEIRRHYKVADNYPNISNINKNLAQGVVEFPDISDYVGYMQSDVDTYMQYGGITGYNGSLLTYVGAPSSSAPSGESTMDVELLMGVCPGVKTVFWTYNDSHDNGFGATMVNVFHALVTETGDVDSEVLKSRGFPRPSTWSMSWAACEIGSDSSYVSEMRRAGAYVAALSASGVTFVGSSGDAGASCDNDQFYAHVGFPIGIPSVVAVGATSINVNGVNVASSSNGAWITSGGGFSTVFASAEQSAVFTLADGISWFNDGLGVPGRGVPDVAAIGTLISTVSYGGVPVVSGGTSASAPITAALITLLNNERLNDYQRNNMTQTTTTLQNIHAWLYQNSSTDPSRNVGGNASMFTDVVYGDNCYGKAQDSMIYPTFPGCYSTRPGWDAVTGWGEVANFSVLLDSALRWNIPAPPPAPPVSVAGIVIGCLGVLFFIVVLAVFAHRMKKKNSGGDSSADGGWFSSSSINNKKASSGLSMNYQNYEQENKEKHKEDFYKGSV